MPREQGIDTEMFLSRLEQDTKDVVISAARKLAKFRKKCENRKLAYDVLDAGAAYDTKRAKRAEITATEKEYNVKLKALYAEYNIIDEPLKELRKKADVNGKRVSKFDTAMEIIVKDKAPGLIEANDTIAAILTESARAVELATTWEDCVVIVDSARTSILAINI